MSPRREPKVMAAAQCPCICHDMLGGPAHYGQRCKCNGGEGMDA